MTDRISFFITLVEMGFRTFYSSGTSSVHDFLSETWELEALTEMGSDSVMVLLITQINNLLIDESIFIITENIEHY